TDQLTRGAIIGNDVVAVDEDVTLGRIDDAADDADQRRFPRAVRPQQREYFAAANVEVDVFQGLEARRISLRDVRDRNDGLPRAAAFSRGISAARSGSFARGAVNAAPHQSPSRDRFSAKGRSDANDCRNSAV